MKRTDTETIFSCAEREEARCVGNRKSVSWNIVEEDEVDKGEKISIVGEEDDKEYDEEYDVVLDMYEELFSHLKNVFYVGRSSSKE